MAKFSTEVLKCDPSSIIFQPGSEQAETSTETAQYLERASNHLHQLQTVAFPTETVYGLGALALNSISVSRIFSTKGRPPDNPLIVHISSLAMLNSLLPPDYNLSLAYQILIRKFWPGALTLLFPRDPKIIPSIVTANHPTVAIRMPSHPVARALIAAAQAPIAAPSANSSGKPSPTRADHVLRDLDGKIGLILDGGACGVGLESTVVDGLREDGQLRVLRPGGVSVEDIESALEDEIPPGSLVPKVLVYQRDFKDKGIEQAPTTPGMKYRHYSPSVPVVLLLTLTPPPQGAVSVLAHEYLAALGDTMTLGRFRKVGLLALSDSPLAGCDLPRDGIEWRRFSLGPTAQPSVTAQRLFDGLITLEKEGMDLILIEEIKAEKEGLAIMNRVQKAAGELKWIRFE